MVVLFPSIIPTTLLCTYSYYHYLVFYAFAVLLSPYLITFSCAQHEDMRLLQTRNMRHDDIITSRTQQVIEHTSVGHIQACPSKFIHLTNYLPWKFVTLVT